MYWHCFSHTSTQFVALSIVDIDTFAVSYAIPGAIGHHSLIPLDQTLFLVPASNGYPQHAYDMLTGRWRRLEGMEGSMAANVLVLSLTHIATTVSDEFWQSVADGNLKC